MDRIVPAPADCLLPAFVRFSRIVLAQGLFALPPGSQISSGMDEREHVHGLFLDLVDKTVALHVNLANLRAGDLNDAPPAFWEERQRSARIARCLQKSVSVVDRFARDISCRLEEIFAGGLAPPYLSGHTAICFSSCS